LQTSKKAFDLTGNGGWWINWDHAAWDAPGVGYFAWGYSTFKGIDAPNVGDYQEGFFTEFKYEFDSKSKDFNGILASLYDNMTTKDNMNLQYIYYVPSDSFVAWTYSQGATAGSFQWNQDTWGSMTSGWVVPKSNANTAYFENGINVESVTLTFGAAGSAPSDVSTAAALAILREVAAGVAGASTADALAILRAVAAQ